MSKDLDKTAILEDALSLVKHAIMRDLDYSSADGLATSAGHVIGVVAAIVHVVEHLLHTDGHTIPVADVKAQLEILRAGESANDAAIDKLAREKFGDGE